MSSRPKPRLLLHIGSQKTGTTSIQQFLARNRSILSERGFYVPDYVGGANHRHAVFLAENSNKREMHLLFPLFTNNHEKKQRTPSQQNRI